MSAVRPQSRPDSRVEGLLRSLQPRMAKILARHAVPPDDAEDLLQDTLFALVYKWDGIRNPEAWLLATLDNRCKIYRNHRDEEQVEAVDLGRLDALAGPQAPPQEQTELRQDLTSAVSRLPAPYRDVLQLRYGLGWKSSEVAAQLGEEPDGLRRLTSRSLVALGRELERGGLTRHNALG
ncbi:MAG: sigma-70 family RNA polymerase sigma factor [bacterium]